MTAFVVIAVLFVATVLLWLSMRRHLGRIHVDGPGEPGEHGTTDAEPGPGTEEPPRAG
jgi:hypothetical protein